MDVHDQSRVAFVGDFLRFTAGDAGYVSSQSRNIAWLFELLAGIRDAGRETSVNVELVAPINGMPLPCTSAEERRAIDSYHEDAELAWAARYDTTAIDVLPDRFERLTEFDLVVGFELPPTLKRYLHAAGVRYISFNVHALRMLRDLCLGASTNCPIIASALEGHVVGASEIDSQIRRFSALCRFLSLPTFVLPEGIPVLIGQTERDSILIDQGRFIGWDEHLDELDDALKGYDTVAFIEHPYRPDSRSIIETLRGRLGKTVLSTNGNGYALLFSNPRIPLVLTLASSLGVEAQAMCIPTRFLLGDPRQRLRVTGVDLGPDAPLGHGVLDGDFFRVLLGRAAPVRAQAKIAESFALGENYIRASLDSWSYGLLQRGLVGATIKRTLYPSSDVSETRLRQLGEQLGDTGHPAEDERRRRTWGIEHQVAHRPLSSRGSRHVEFGRPEAAQYLGSGFHAIEPWGAWTADRAATLRIAVDSAAVSEGTALEVTLALRVYEGLLAHCPVVRVCCKGEVLGYAFFRPSAPGVRTLRFRIQHASTYQEVQLEVSDLESPARITEQADQRFLGIALSGIELACYESVNERDEPAAPFIDLGEHHAVPIGPRKRSAV